MSRRRAAFGLSGDVFVKPFRDYGDVRELANCAFCGGETGTRDHCPSRVFLDEPYPIDLPVVPACSACNAGFSLDEEYLACLVSCVVAGSTDPEAVPREKIGRILTEKPALRARIELACVKPDGRVCFTPEHARVTSVATKLAQGHALYELHEPCARPPDAVTCLPLSVMTGRERLAFENPALPRLWPEAGSRALQRMVTEGRIHSGGWLGIQPGRYRFRAVGGGDVDIRIVIHEYLACHVRWGGELP